MVMAPSGKAASNIGGSTIHASLKIPVSKQKDSASYTPLANQPLRQLQQQFRSDNVKGIIIDEYTMLSQRQLSFINKRLQQITTINEPFGGLFVLIVGDPAQLPPVSGRSLWFDRPEKADQAEGRALYEQFKSHVVKLQGSNRLIADEHKDWLASFFANLRTGDVTREQWTFLLDHTSEEHFRTTLGSEQAFHDKFLTGDATYYFNTNAQITEHNCQMLKQTGHPICRIDALHNCAKAEKGGDEQADRLTTRFYVTIGSKVMLTWNECVRSGLVNGSTGVVKDIFAPGTLPPASLPTTIIVEIPSYCGPPFFTNLIDDNGIIVLNRAKWVPVKQVTASWYPQGVTLQRTAFPLVLAWGWTPWKGQGTTNRGPCVMHPGLKEQTDGLGYVMLSRVTTLHNMLIPGGIAFERLTTKIKAHAGHKLRVQEERHLEECAARTLVLYEQLRAANLLYGV